MGEKTKEDDNEVIERGNWSKKLDFILSCVGFAVGLGNVWRFPYLCYRNGGVAFLIPYTIMLVLAGLPLFMFECALGQFSSEGPITVWKFSPIFRGVGWGMLAVSAMVCVYYNVIISYALYYMMVSFVNMDSLLPWTTCNSTWTTKWCKDDPYPDFKAISGEADRMSNVRDIMNMTCAFLPSTLEKYMNATNTTGLVEGDFNSTMLLTNTFKDCKYKFTSPSDEYWNNYVLERDQTDYIGDLEGISWKNFVGLLFAWVLVFFCLMKGVKSSGKVVYFTATFPYVVLIVLLIRGVTLPGYQQGIEFYIVPTSESWERLKDPKIWGDAATQIFYSLGPAWGGLLTMSSYNKFHNHCYRDSIIIACINCGTSVFAGFVIFSMLGFMAHETNQLVEDVATSGPGLLFIVYPAGIAQLPGAAVWGFIFFFMIITLGLDSQFVMTETVISGITDLFPRALRKHKTLFTFLVCLVLFLLGIPLTTKGGIYILTLIDWYSASYGLLVIAFFEIISVSWVYGLLRFADDFKMMLGYRPNIYWLATWVFISPAVVIFILIMSIINYSEAYYGDYVFEEWAQGIGWVMVGVPAILIIVCAIVEVVLAKVRSNRRGEPMGLWGAIKKAAHHTDDWGPALDEHRQLDPIRYGSLGTPGKNAYSLDNVAFDSEKPTNTHL